VKRKEVAVNLLIPDIPVLEKVIRSAVVYLFLLAAFRLAGKRQLGQMTPFDLVVLLIISNVVQNALIGNDNSLGGGLGATVILLLNAVLAWLTFRHKRVERVVEHSPTVLVKHGQILRENLRRERLSLPELRAALRREGVVSFRNVRYVILEEDGHLSVIARGSASA
jgi:uncharacterized membrane protein YcaP (DUF421 family)